MISGLKTELANVREQLQDRLTELVDNAALREQLQDRVTESEDNATCAQENSNELERILSVEVFDTFFTTHHANIPF